MENLRCGIEGTKVNNVFRNVNMCVGKSYFLFKREVNVIRLCGFCLIGFLNLKFKMFYLI